MAKERVWEAGRSETGRLGPACTPVPPVFLAAAASGLWFRSCAWQEGAGRACGLLVAAHLLLMILQSFSFHC